MKAPLGDDHGCHRQVGVGPLSAPLVTLSPAASFWFKPSRLGCSSGLVVVARLKDDEVSVQHLVDEPVLGGDAA